MSLLRPVSPSTITQHFGNLSNLAEPRAYHRGDEDASFSFYAGATLNDHVHLGTDFAAPQGAEVLASEAGVVTYADWAANPGPYAGGGNIVEIAIDGGASYVNCHLSEIRVLKGHSVIRGQRIGSVGSTGTSTGPHDHFIVCKQAGGVRRFLNPEDYLPGGKYADSPLIKPAALPDTSTEDAMLAWVNSITPAALRVRLAKGQPVRTAPVLSGSTVAFTVATDSTLTIIGKVAGDVYLGSTTWYVYVLGKGGLRVVHSKQVTPA